MGKTSKMAVVAWLLVLFYYFYQYALLGPVFGLILVNNHSAGSGQFIMKDYQATFMPLIIGVGLAIILTLFLKETGRTNMIKQQKT
jgi:hypothetical protein